MKLEELIASSQDQLINVITTIKILKDEIILLTKKNAELQESYDNTLHDD